VNLRFQISDLLEDISFAVDLRLEVAHGHDGVQGHQDYHDPGGGDVDHEPAVQEVLHALLQGELAVFFGVGFEGVDYGA
jgi:hypothetical protein